MRVPLHKGVDTIFKVGGGGGFVTHAKNFDPIVSRTLKCIKISYFQQLFPKFVCIFWLSNYDYSEYN